MSAGYGDVASLATGTTTTGGAAVYSLSEPPLLANYYYCSGGVMGPANLCDGTDTYWAAMGIDSGISTVYPTSGAFFVYDMYNANSIVSNATFSATWTNNWIAVCANGSTYTNVDTKLPVIASSTPTNRFLVIATTTAIFYYTNGVLSATITNATPTVNLYMAKAIMKKTATGAGTTSRNLLISTPWIHVRQTERTYP